jgi:hypothetical protein
MRWRRCRPSESVRAEPLTADQGLRADQDELVKEARNASEPSPPGHIARADPSGDGGICAWLGARVGEMTRAGSRAGG